MRKNIIPLLFPLLLSANDYDVSDFSWDKVNWLHTNVGGWAETSKITSVSIKESGEICIRHTKANAWPAGQAHGNSLMGNPWIIVKLNGRYYAGTWEWLRPGQECKLGHLQYGLAGLYRHPTESLPKHIKREPLNSWSPSGGLIVGFMVSGLARGRERNVEERSNVHWVMLPSDDGIIKGHMGFRSSSNSRSVATACNPPDKSQVVQTIADQHPDALRNSCQRDGGTWDFMDKVVSELRSEDSRWGYNCKRGNCNDPSHDAIAYYCGDGFPNSRSTNVAIIDMILDHCPGNTGAVAKPGWLDVTQKTLERNAVGRWLYPRPGGPTANQ